MLFSTSGTPWRWRLVWLTFSLIAMMFWSACWVESINGLDEAQLFGPSDPDRTLEPAFAGTWLLVTDKCTATINITAENDEYTWRETGEGEDCINHDGKKELFYRSALYKLNGHLFLDQTARSEDVCDICRAVHWIFLVHVDKNSITMTPIDSDWLKKSIRSNAVTLATLGDDTDVITATPKELKEFCRRYADNKDAFKPVPDLVLKRKAEQPPVGAHGPSPNA